MTKTEEALLDDLLAVESGLSAWEIDFIDNLDGLRDRVLTPKQVDKMHDIARKVGLED